MGNVQQLKVSTCLKWQENRVTSNAAETFKDIYHVSGATLGNHEVFLHTVDNLMQKGISVQADT